MSTVLSTSNLKVGYDKKVVIDNVDLKGMRGQLICLLGPNGVGKTTILRTITGLLTPVEGAVFLGRDNIMDIRRQDLAKKMAVVLTERVSLQMMTVFEIASMGRYAHTNFQGKLSKQDLSVVEKALRAVKAIHLRDKYYAQISDGEKQKVMIARALVQEPEVIVLDEPTSHLDIRHKVEVINILRDLCKNKGITVILSLHDIDLAIKGCQTILLMEKGKVVAQGTPEEIIREGTIQSLYELKGANYSELLGSVEFCHGNIVPEVFVVGGGGKGSEVLRALLREGMGTCCGIMHKNDVDFFIGKSLGCSMITEESFSSISDEVYERALNQIRDVQYVIDTGFPVGETNARNLDLIQEAARQGKKVFSLREDKEMNDRYMVETGAIDQARGITSILEMIREDKKGSRAILKNGTGFHMEEEG